MEFKSMLFGTLNFVLQLYSIIKIQKIDAELYLTLNNFIMKPIAKSKAAAKFRAVLSLLLLCPMMSFSQGDTINLIKGGELLFGGLITIFSSKPKNVNTTVVESVCIKNKLEDKITFILTRQTEDGDEIRKELVIQKSSREYFYELPKGVYTYEVHLANAEIFKKGEYRFVDKSTFIVDGDIIKNPEE